MEKNWVTGASIFGIIGFILSIFVFVYTAFSKYRKDKKFKIFYYIAGFTFIICTILIFICAIVELTLFLQGLDNMLRGCE